MKIQRALNFPALTLAAICLLALATGPAHAAPVQYSTTASFNGGAFSSPNAIVFGGMGNQMSITFTGVTNSLVDASPTTFASFGQVQTAITGTGATITPGTTFGLRITQTIPAGGSGDFAATMSGTVSQNASSGVISFTITSVSIGSVTYSLTNSSIPLMPPSTNNGIATIGGQISTAPPSADLSLTKTPTPSGTVPVGSNVVFALTVTNSGPANATGVTVADALPAGLTYVSNDCGAGFLSPNLTWNVGALAASASATCNLTVTVTQPGAIVNSASAGGNEADPVSSNNTGQATVMGQQSVLEIPTLGGISLAALALLLAASAAVVLRRA